MSAHLPLLSHEKPCQLRKILAQGDNCSPARDVISDTGSYSDMISGLLRVLGTPTSTATPKPELSRSPTHPRPA